MEKNNPISDLLQESMTKLRELADTNSIVGQPIHTPDGVHPYQVPPEAARPASGSPGTT